MLEQFLSDLQHIKNPRKNGPGEAGITQEKRLLRKWESNLKKREAALRREQENLEAIRQQQALTKRKLEESRQEIIHRSEELKKQHDYVEAAFLNYRQEFKLWQQKQDHSPQKILENNLAQLHHSFTMIRGDLSTAQNMFIHLIEQTQEIQDKGITELCWLHREAAASSGETIQHFARQLAVILRDSFGAEPIEPLPGDPFDSRTSERLCGDGNVVTGCLHRGWKWCGGVFRAIVTVQNGH